MLDYEKELEQLKSEILELETMLEFQKQECKTIYKEKSKYVEIKKRINKYESMKSLYFYISNKCQEYNKTYINKTIYKNKLGVQLQDTQMTLHNLKKDYRNINDIADLDLSVHAYLRYLQRILKYKIEDSIFNDKEKERELFQRFVKKLSTHSILKYILTVEVRKKIKKVHPDCRNYKLKCDGFTICVSDKTITTIY